MEMLLGYEGVYASAKNAKEDLDIDTILNGCNQLETQISNLSYCIRELNIAMDELNTNTFSINGSISYADKISSYIDEISSFQSDAYNMINQIRVNSLTQYNQIQSNYNNQAIQRDK